MTVPKTVAQKPGTAAKTAELLRLQDLAASFCPSFHTQLSDFIIFELPQTELGLGQPQLMLLPHERLLNDDLANIAIDIALNNFFNLAGEQMERFCMAAIFAVGSIGAG